MPFQFIHAQQDSSFAAPAYKNQGSKKLSSSWEIAPKSFIIPAALIGFGTLSTIVRENKRTDAEEVIPTTKKETSILLEPENYTALAPAVAVFGLQAIGIEGAHTAKEQAILLAMSAGLSSLIVYPLKNNTQIMRPDQSDTHSFPSGHTAIAFVAAEFMRREYGHLSPWYTVAGYAAATTTGILRVAKDKHWIADAAAGAGIGMASTTAAYWIFNKIKIKSKGKESSVFILPAVSGTFFGLYFTKAL